ncbi:MAG: ribosome assembly RNA-binding protein YhbY [Defluviitaleaceae bacterium]|nr:ribosome assembly RNA-binding protein YhbY [Defluviitaleaceae bacterium]
MTTKQRAYLRSISNKLQPVFQIGKSGITPEIVEAIDSYLEANELMKITMLKNCDEDIREVAGIVSERTHSEIVQVIGKRAVFYRESKKKPVITLPKA